MKVLKEGIVYEKKQGAYTMKCGFCTAMLSFTANDVNERFTRYDLERFVTCPRCKERLRVPSGEVLEDLEEW